MLLDSEAMNYIRQRKAEGATYMELEKEIAGLGYKTSTGGKIWYSQISQFAIKNGLRKNITKAVRSKKIRNVETFNAANIAEAIKEFKAEGLSIPKIAKKLNHLGYTTTTGLKFNHWRLRAFERAALANPPKEKAVSPVNEVKVRVAKYEKQSLLIADADMIKELVGSNLSKATKLALLEQVIK